MKNQKKNKLYMTKMMLSVCPFGRIVSSIGVSFVSFNIGMLNSSGKQERKRGRTENRVNPK